MLGSDELGLEPNGKLWTKVLARKGSGKVHRVVTGEHNPFWVTVFFWSRFDGSVDIPPCVIHKAAVQRGDLLYAIRGAKEPHGKRNYVAVFAFETFAFAGACSYSNAVTFPTC